jgi:peptide/nickel transport system substrate-binding protein
MSKVLRMRTLTSIAAAAVLALALGVGQASAQKRGGELHSIIQLEPPHIAMGLNLQLPTQVVSSKIFQSLIKYDFDFNPVPVLAESWTAAPDGKTYTFKLRRGVTWHDGKPFTAADVLFTINEIMPLHPLSRRVFARVDSTTAPDDYTVVFKLKQSYAPFLSAWDISSTPIYPKHLYEGTDYRKNEYNQKPVGTGPFKFAEWKKGSHIKLVRNDNYWKKGLPYLDAIYFHVLPDSATRAVQLEQGKVHFTSWGNIEGPDVARLEKLPHLEMTTKGYEMLGTMMWLEFNHRKAPLNDVRFRKAVALAIDRKFIRDNIYYGLGKIPNGPLSTVTRFYDPNVKMDWEYNPERAKKLLDEMGFKPDKDGVRVRTTLLPIAASYGEQFVRSAEYIKQALADVGIDAKIQSVDAPTWIKRMANGEFDLSITFMGQYGDPELGVARSYISSNIKKGVPFNNTAGYSNAKVDELFNMGAVEMDPKKRATIYSQLQQEMVDDVAVVWFLEYEYPHFINKKFKNVIVDVHGNKGDFEGAYMVQ